MCVCVYVISRKPWPVWVRVTQGLSLSNSPGVIETNGLSFSILIGGHLDPQKERCGALWGHLDPHLIPMVIKEGLYDTQRSRWVILHVPPSLTMSRCRVRSISPEKRFSNSYSPSNHPLNPKRTRKSQTEKRTDKEMEKQTEKQTEKQAEKKTDKKTDKKMEKQTKKQTEKQTEVMTQTTARKTTTETMKTTTMTTTKNTTQWLILLHIHHPVEKKKKDKTTASPQVIPSRNGEITWWAWRAAGPPPPLLRLKARSPRAPRCTRCPAALTRPQRSACSSRRR